MTPMTSIPSIKTPTLSPVQPDQLTVYANRHDLRRDLHTFVGYVKQRSIKRSYRGNSLPQAEYKRLARLIPDADGATEAGSSYDDNWYGSGAEASSWIEYVDRLALKMGFVAYDTTGAYRGYSSAEPSFADNVMRVEGDTYRRFLALSLAEQERRLLDTLIDDFSSSYNEFYTVGIQGRLDRFPTWGSSLGLMPGLNFAAIRRFLLDQL
jgi:hypothetical protein